MDAFEIARLLRQRDSGLHTYEEFFRSETLSLGLSVWPAGSVDAQSPHAEDEVYYVVSGRGQISVAGEQLTVQAGSIVFVGARMEHRFHDIEESLTVLVFWAPPHRSRE